jgi:opacity protein-like surface antigen
MNRLWLGSIALVFAAASNAASAADAALPVKAPPAAVVYNWSGFYLGAHAGYSWSTKEWFQGDLTNIQPS